MFLGAKSKQLNRHVKSTLEEDKCDGAVRAFLMSNIFIGNARLKFAKNQAHAKQHTEVELLLFENYLHSSSTLSNKSNRTYSKK